MSTRVIIVVVEVNDAVSQGDEFETLMDDIETVVDNFRDPAIRRTRVHDTTNFEEWIGKVLLR